MHKFAHYGFELKNLRNPEPDFIVEPWLKATEYCLLFGPTGIGKSYFAYDLGIHIACGVPFWGFNIPRPRRVFYIDGEMGNEELGDRIHLFDLDDRFREALGDENRNFKTTSFDSYDDMPNLSDPTQNIIYDQQMAVTEVVIVDNLMSCSNDIGSGDSEYAQWNRISTWIKKQRRANRTVIIVHHAGKSGDQFGTSKKMNQCHVALELRDASWNEEFQAESTLPIELRFRKARRLSRSQSQPVFAERYFPLDQAPYWLIKPLRDEKKKLAIKLKKQRMSKRDIAELLGVKNSTISQWLLEPEQETENDDQLF